jgi:DNA-binding LytR/AlgR family response regulator
MKYKCIIVDDEELARELIERHLSQLDNFELIASCASVIEAHKVLQNKTIDLIFMDIEMPVLKGTDFIKNLKTKPKVIFTTAYRDYAIEGFELDAIDYLLKPIVFERFFQAIEKFIAQQNPNDIIDETASIYIRVKKKNIKVVLNDILYVESLKDYVKIHLSNETLVFKHGITAFERKLANHFLRIHRSYIINSEKITAYTKNDVEIGNREIPIGEFYKEDTLEKLSKPLN